MKEMVNVSRLLFDGHEYSLVELIDLRSKSHLYKKGEVLDTDTGEVLDIQQIDNWRDKYIDEIMSIRKKYGTTNSVFLTSATKKIIEEDVLKDLQSKFNSNPESLTIEELKDLIELKLKPDNRKMLKLSFSNFYTRNKKEDYPADLTFNDIGRYDKMLKYLTKYCDLRDSNRKDSSILKSNKLSDELELSDKRFYQYLNKIQNSGLIKYIKEVDGSLLIFINPVYSYMQGEIDYTIYTIFRNDLDEYLTKEEVEYLKRISAIESLRYANRVLHEDI